MHLHNVKKKCVRIKALLDLFKKLKRMCYYFMHINYLQEHLKLYYLWFNKCIIIMIHNALRFIHVNIFDWSHIEHINQWYNLFMLQNYRKNLICIFFNILSFGFNNLFSLMCTDCIKWKFKKLSDNI